MKSKAVLVIATLGFAGLAACTALIGLHDVPIPADGSMDASGMDTGADVADASALDVKDAMAGDAADAADSACIKSDAGPWGNPDCCGANPQACHTRSCYKDACVRLVFVTKGVFTCDFLDAGTDPCGKVTPTDPPLMGKTFAMLALGGDGYTNATANKYDLYLADGKHVVVPFMSAIDNAIARDESGGAQGGGDVWTGYTAGFDAGLDCASWKNVNLSAQGGNMLSTTNWVWLDKQSPIGGGSTSAHLYCVERDRF